VAQNQVILSHHPCVLAEITFSTVITNLGNRVFVPFALPLMLYLRLESTFPLSVIEIPGETNPPAGTWLAEDSE